MWIYLMTLLSSSQRLSGEKVLRYREHDKEILIATLIGPDGPLLKCSCLMTPGSPLINTKVICGTRIPGVLFKGSSYIRGVFR